MRVSQHYASFSTLCEFLNKAIAKKGAYLSRELTVQLTVLTPQTQFWPADELRLDLLPLCPAFCVRH